MLDTIKQFFDANLSAATDAGSSVEQEHAYQLAAAALFVEMTRADHEVKGIERDAAARAVRQAFQLEASETEDLLALAEQKADHATSTYEFTRLINNHFDADQKEHFVELLWQVALADGEIDRYEEHLVRKIADLIHVPHRSYIRAKHRAMERPPAVDGENEA